MAQSILIIGETGSGKSTSIEELNPNETFIINVIGKSLPFRNFRTSYKPFSRNSPEGNILVTDNFKTILSTLEYISDKRTDVKQIIIDDFQYVMSNEFMRRANEKGYDKFTQIGEHAWLVIEKPKHLREDLVVVFLAHSEETESKKRKIKTIGRMLDEKITLEGMFSIVLFCDVERDKEGNKHFFVTQSDGTTTAKSPKGMFETNQIENNLKLVLEKVDEYYT